MAIIKRADKITERTKQRVYFTDIKTDFDLANYRDLQLVENEVDILQSIHNLIMTNFGERLYNPLWGCDIRSLLFENITPHTEGVAQQKIKTAIENFEPRAKLHDVVVQGDPDQNALYVTITISVINKQEPITLEFVLTRIR